MLLAPRWPATWKAPRACSTKLASSEPAEHSARQASGAFHDGQLPETHPLAAACLEDLGEALAGLKRYREAIPALEKAVEIHGRLGPAYAKTADRLQVELNQPRNHL